jgi:hypothetical protein
MAAGAGESLEVERLLSYTEDLVGVLRAIIDRDGNLRRRRAPNRYAHPSLPFVLCETEHRYSGYICIQI